VGVEVDVWSSSESSSAKCKAIQQRMEGLEVQKVLGLSALGCKQVNVGLGRPWRSAVSFSGDGRCSKSRGTERVGLQAGQRRPRKALAVGGKRRRQVLEVQDGLGLSALGCMQVNVGLGRPWRSAVSLAATAGARSPGGLSELGCKQANVGLGRPWRSAASGDGRCSKSRRFWG